MYYTVIKHSGHLKTLEKCRKHSPAARVVYISLVFSNARRVLSQCNTRLRLLYLLSVEVHCKITNRSCSLLFTLGIQPHCLPQNSKRSLIKKCWQILKLKVNEKGNILKSSAMFAWSLSITKSNGMCKYINCNWSTSERS